MVNMTKHHHKDKIKVDPLVGLDGILNSLKCAKLLKQRELYVDLVVKLSTVYSNVKSPMVLERILALMTPRKEWTKGEKRLMYAGKILALGALLRSRKLSSFNIPLINTIFKEIIELALRKYSLLNIGTPFLCSVLNTLPSDQIKELDLSPIQTLLDHEFKNEGACLLRIALTCKTKELEVNYPKLDEISTLVDHVLYQVRHEDDETIQLLFSYLKTTHQMKEFWKVFSSQLGPYHFNLLYSCLKGAVEQGCSKTLLLKPPILSPILEVFRWDESEPIKKAINGFRLLLSNWKINGPTKSKHREQIIKLCFGDELNLLSQYKYLHSVLREFIMNLNEDELDLVKNLTHELITQNKSGTRNAAVTFLSRIGVVKTTKLETKVDIGKQLIKLGYCQTSTQSEDDDKTEKTGGSDSETTLLKITQDALTSLLKSVYNPDFINPIYKFVESLAKGKENDVSLKKPFTAEQLDYFKAINKLNRKVMDPEVDYITKMYAVYLLVDHEFATQGLEQLLPLCKDLKGKTRSEIAKSLVEFMIPCIQVEKVIFNYESMFIQFLMDESIQADSVEALTSAISLDDDEEGSGDEKDEDDDDDDDSDEEKEVGKNGLAEKDTDDDDDEDEHLEEHNMDTTTIPSQEKSMDSDEESLDMDNMEEGQLDAMDKALAGIFTLKKTMKQEKEMEKIFFMRIFTLLEDILRRYKEPPRSIPLILLSACLSQLSMSNRSSKLTESRSRGFALLRRLNMLKKIKEEDNDSKFDSSMVNELISNLGILLSRKLDKKPRNLLKQSVCMLARVYFQGKTDEIEDNDVKVIIESCVQSQQDTSTNSTTKKNRKRKHSK